MAAKNRLTEKTVAHPNPLPQGERKLTAVAATLGMTSVWRRRDTVSRGALANPLPSSDKKPLDRAAGLR